MPNRQDVHRGQSRGLRHDQAHRLADTESVGAARPTRAVLSLRPWSSHAWPAGFRAYAGRSSMPVPAPGGQASERQSGPEAGGDGSERRAVFRRAFSQDEPVPGPRPAAVPKAVLAVAGHDQGGRRRDRQAAADEVALVAGQPVFGNQARSVRLGRQRSSTPPASSASPTGTRPGQSTTLVAPHC